MRMSVLSCARESCDELDSAKVVQVNWAVFTRRCRQNPLSFGTGVQDSTLGTGVSVRNGGSVVCTLHAGRSPSAHAEAIKNASTI